MAVTLPSTFTVRAARSEDLHDVLELINEWMTYAYGEPDYEEAGLREDWGREGFDVTRDAWIVTAETGQIIGYADLWKEHGEIWVHSRYLQAGIGEYLIDLLHTERLQRAEAAGETEEVKLLMWANGLTEEEPAFYERHGYQTIRVFWRMRIDFEDGYEPETPALPVGYTVRAMQPGEERTMHAVIQQAFSEHWGSKPSTFEEWYERLQRSNFDPTLWLVAERGGEIVGALTAMNFMEDGGFVRQLGVLSSERGSGIGMALLKHAFANFRRRGKAYVALGVDAENTTGATRLYERAGMRAVRSFVRYQKVLK